MAENVIKLEGAALRLCQFIQTTKMNYSQFARECNLNHAKNITTVCTNGNQPSSKLLEKIIKRFPMLNYDWVLLGYGEMIVKGLQTQETSAESLKMSNVAVFNQIQQALNDHDYSLNKLGSDIIHARAEEKATSNEFRLILQGLKDSQQSANELLFSKHQIMMQEQEKLVRQLHKERKELALKLHEERKKTNREFWDTIKQDFDKKIENNWEKFEQIIIDTNTHFDGLMVDLNKKLDKNTQTAIDTITDNGKDNTAKALKALGEHSINPKPSK